MVTIYLASERDYQGVAEIARKEGIDYSHFERHYGIRLFQKSSKSFFEAVNRIAQDYLGRTVMVIDDRPDLLELLEMRFDGCDVRLYENPRKAVDDIRNGKVRPELVLTDLQMPEMTGFDVVKEIRELG